MSGTFMGAARQHLLWKVKRCVPAWSGCEASNAFAVMENEATLLMLLGEAGAGERQPSGAPDIVTWLQ